LAAQGTVEGLILTSPRGSNGFGYDPLFYVPALQRTMAEVDDHTRWIHSHRGEAFRALLQLFD
jgi:XTP/dITP diphosphohydrolase